MGVLRLPSLALLFSPSKTLTLKPPPLSLLRPSLLKTSASISGESRRRRFSARSLAKKEADPPSSPPTPLPSAAPADRKSPSSQEGAVTPRSVDFNAWYVDVIASAELADYGPVRGTMVIRPYGYAIWESIQDYFNLKFKETGHSNMYFPQFIPYSFIEKEASHVEGFSPELAVVTIGGGKELEEKLVVRPTSETIVNHMFTQWIQSYRDLPLLINQWANVTRWEMRTKPFIRTLEFLWQEGHTAHATPKEAEMEALLMIDVYKKYAYEQAAIPVIVGRKSRVETFAGADCTYTIEAMMGDKKALQAGTSHNLGQNFSRAFGTQFTDENGQRQHIWQTSWAISTRFVGAIIMTHGDDAGLMLPPRLAPIQVVIVPIWKKTEEQMEVLDAAVSIEKFLRTVGIKVKLDDSEQRTPGWKFNFWEMKGVPLRIEVGPRDVANRSVVISRRDIPGKPGKDFGISMEPSVLEAHVKSRLEDIQASLLQRAISFRDSNIVDVNSYEELKAAISQGKWARGPWSAGDAEEHKVKEETSSVGSTPASASSSSSAMIPAGSRKMVLSLKEIVDCSEAEIYAMLKECNMDPSEAIHRLLNQDTFHEVKSKRDKKKETKEPDFRLRAVNNNSSHGARGGTGRTGSIQSSSYDYGAALSKPVRKKENGTNVVHTSTATAGSGIPGNSLNRRSATLSEVVTMQSTPVVPAIADMPPLSSQPSPVLQQSWARAPGQLSMADVVRMGRPQNKQPSFTPTHDSFTSNMPDLSGKQPPPTTMSQPNLVPESSEVIVSHEEEPGHELDTGDDWSIHPEISTTPSLHADEVNSEQNPHLDDGQLAEGDANGDTLQPESTISAYTSDGQTDTDNSEEGAQVDDGQLDAMDSYHTQRHALERHEDGDVDEQISSTALDLQQLNLHKGEFDASPSEDNPADNPAVIIPSHLQVTNADCSHLSFGSFGSAVNASLSGSFQSNPLRNNLEMTPVAEDSTSLDQLISRNTEYYDDDQLQSTLNDNVTSITNTNTRSYDMPEASQAEISRDDNFDAALQGNFPTASGYAFSTSSEQTAATYAYPDPNSQMQNLSHFSNLMQPYTNSLPSSLLALTVQTPGEFDIPFSALLANQAMKYNTQAPSMSGPITTSEVKQEVFSAPQQTPQALPTSSIPTPAGPTLPQHLPTYPYSQPTLPLGHFANMFSYPFLPQSYTFLPSAAYQQAYTANSPFHQTPTTGMKYSALPQYKSSISASSNLPQSPSLPPGYGGFTSSTNITGYRGFMGSTNNIPAGFSLNPTNTTASTGMGFEEAPSLQYKEGSQYLPLQHNENSAMWLHGAGSRAAISALPGNTFYGIQAHQNQQNGSGFRQTQQQLSQYGPGPMGYLNIYQSQGGPSQEQIQQNPSKGNVSGSQGPVLHQMWQQHGHRY